MSKNVGHLDRLVRIMFGLGMIFQGVLVGNGTGCVLAVAGFLPLITGITSKCPIYALLNLNTID
jgi:hypothetical protein